MFLLHLHGGDGENGTLQNQLIQNKVLFNGPDAKVSKLCVDKWATNEFISQLNIKGVTTTLGKALTFSEIENTDISNLWKNIRSELSAKTLIIKPRSDGCSSGVIRLYTENDLRTYLTLVKENATTILKAPLRIKIRSLNYHSNPLKI